MIWIGGSLLADGPAPAADTQSKSDPDYLTFVRVKYDSSGGFGEAWYQYEGRIWERWETDFPRGERNFLYRLQQLTSFRVNPEPVVVRLTDEELFDYPFLFMSDVGWQILSERECRQLKSYLDRGGFLWADDFWGQAEWRNFESNMRRVAPEWQWKPIPASHPVFRTVYPLEECPQIPARIFYESSGLHFDPPGVHRQPVGSLPQFQTVDFRGLFDEDGELRVIATHNTDIADGWEREGEDQEFFERFSIRAYALGINILVYAATH